MEARAINRYIGSSPRKMRLVIDLIRGKSAEEALNVLHFSPKHASKVAEKVLRSAISNLQNNRDAGRIEPDDLYVKEAFVNAGFTMKRISPAPMGRAYRIRKRSNHVTIIVATKEKVVTKAMKPAGSAKKQGSSAPPAPEKTTSTKKKSSKKKEEAAAE
jgi:large subunit ribosomal protein L22